MRRLLSWLAVFIAIVGIGPLAEAVTVRFTLVRNADGTRDTAYPAGDKAPNVATLAWTAGCIPSLSALVNSTGITTDVRTPCLTGTGAATAVIDVVTISGNTASSTFSISSAGAGNNLVTTCPGTASGVLSLRATVTGNSVLSDTRNWACSPAAGSDTTAPPIVTGLESTGVDVGTVDLRWDSSCDNYDGGSASGTKQYVIRRDSTVVDTVASAACARGATAQTIIGSSDGTPASTQTGNNWALSFGGAGTGGTTHNLLVRGLSIAGDITLITKITGLTSSATFAKIGVGAFESSATNAPYCVTHYQINGQLQMQCRSAAGASRITQGSVSSITLPVWVKQTRVGDLWSSYYSTTGAAWTAIVENVSVPMASAVLAGGYITSNTAATNATGTIEQLNIHAAGQVTHTVTTATGGTFTVRVDDNNNNQASYSTGVAATPVAPPATPAIKWHPGIYVNLGTNLKDNNLSTVNSQITTLLNEIGPYSVFKGIHLKVNWSMLEGATAGDYSAGFAFVDSVLTKLAASATPKRPILQITTYAYGGCTSSNSSGGIYTGGVYLPAYVKNTSGWVDYCAPSRNYTAATWVSAVTDRKIALSAAYAARYNTHPLFEMFQFEEESAANFGNLGTGYTLAASRTQWNRLVAAAVGHWTQTQVRSPINWVGSISDVQSLMANNWQIGIAFGGPDSVAFALRNIDANRVWLGQNSDGSDNTAWPDMRGGISSYVSEVQGTNSIYGTGGVGQTLQQLQDFMHDTMHTNYSVWTKQSWNAYANQHWDQLFPFLRDGNAPVYSTACPPSWTCNTN